jgi:tRNA(Arg) A34 adenosine deaminase TadA
MPFPRAVGAVALARRRLVLGAACSAGLAATGCGQAVQPSPAATATPAAVATAPSTIAATAIAQPATATPAAFMAIALEQRRLAVISGDQAFGAVVVKEGRIVGLGPSRVIVNGDPTAHAEIEAIRDACRRLGARDLSGCELYATARPCPMCAAAAAWANIARVYHGEGIADAGPPRLAAC